MTTRTYQEIRQQIAALEIEAEEARNREMAEARGKIMDIMREHGLRAEDLVSSVKQGMRKRGPAQPKYKDPNTGVTWSGMGRTPHWAKDKNLDELRIAQ